MARHAKESVPQENNKRRRIAVGVAASALAVGAVIGVAAKGGSEQQPSQPAPVQEYETPGIAAEDASRQAARAVTEAVGCLLAADTANAHVDRGPEGVEKVVATDEGQVGIWATRSSDTGIVTVNVDRLDDTTGQSDRLQVQQYVSPDNPMMTAGEFDESVILAGPGELTASDVTHAYAIRGGEDRGSILFEGNELKYQMPGRTDSRTLQAEDVQAWMGEAGAILQSAADAIGNPDCLPR